MPRHQWCSLAEAGTHTFVQYLLGGSHVRRRATDATDEIMSAEGYSKDCSVRATSQVENRMVHELSIGSVENTLQCRVEQRTRISDGNSLAFTMCATGPPSVEKFCIHVHLVRHAAPKQELKDVIGSMIPTSVPTSFKVKPETKRYITSFDDRTLICIILVWITQQITVQTRGRCVHRAQQQGNSNA